MGAPFQGPGLSQSQMPLTQSCLQHSPGLEMDSHHFHRQSWKRAPRQVKDIPTSRGAIPSCMAGEAWREHAALWCLASPAITHCPVVAPEPCFPQAQSSLGHRPSLTQVMRRHYRQRGMPTGTDTRHRKATPATSRCYGYSRAHL